MKPEPLKGKIEEKHILEKGRATGKVLGYISYFRKEDVRSAVEWLKEQILDNRYKKTSPFFTRTIPYYIIDEWKLKDLIDEAFADVVEERK